MSGDVTDVLVILIIDTFPNDPMLDAPATGMLLNSFAVPRGIVINAGGTVEPDATSFELVAEAGSETFGICQNPFLIENFKVVRYILKLKLNNDGSFDYEQDTQLQVKGRGLLHHTDTNHLKRQPS